MKANIAFISLGCDKNRVDSEVMLGILKERGYNPVSDESDADIIVINTCCFIKDALEESIETIIETAQYKEEGKCRGIIVAGCLAQRYEKEIFEEMPEVDAVIGTAAYESVADVADRILGGEKRIKVIEDIDTHMNEENAGKRIISTSGHYAYLKISEGCDNHCTYCIIPKLRGKHRSRTMESLVEETKQLAEAGVKELLVVAQDTSIYGRDIYKYIDIPIQHVSDTVLKRMGRISSRKLITDKIAELIKAMPDICIRTTIITGFPGETEEEFEELADFVKELRFDKLGVFTYSPEEGTPAAEMKDQIDESVKEERKDYIMELQKTISAEKCSDMNGKTIRVIVDGKIPEEGIYCGRSYKDAPDIDGLVFFKSDYEIMSGDFADVKINEASDYDLIGEAVY